MASVLITGGAGFIGTHLCKHLHDLGHQVISLDCNHVADQPWGCVAGDIRDSLELDGIDIIVHLAAQISVPISIEHPDETLSVNVDGTSSIIAAAESSGVKRILFASSAAVYGDSEQVPISEEAPLIPQSPYAVSKIIGEELLRRSEIESCSFRFFNVYGPNQSAEGGYAAVIPAFKKAIAEGKECTIFGDGTQIRDFIHVDDLVRIIGLAIAAEKLPLELNIASGEATSLLDLIEILGESNPDLAPPVFQEERAGDIHTSLADISRLLGALPVGDMIGIKEGLV
ncbi:MAG: NAD-dependent epimerase/dehydratase family protein [Candidatus Poseidoniales archaeon]|jgi:UDP-glucose 4-epimerase